MDQTTILIEPQAAYTVLYDAMHITALRNASRNKTAILEVHPSARRSHPNPPTIVLKQRLHGVVRQSIFLMERRNLPVLPSAETVVGSDPDASIHCRQHRPGRTLRRPRNRGNARDRD